NDETRKAALGFIEGIYAGGSTNIDGALRAALTPLHDSSRPSLVLFLTDGLPTDGEQNEAKIIENAKQYNKVHARIFTFGVGYDLNSRLLDKLARENFGDSEYVRPNENIESRVSALYNRISAPVLSDLSIKWDIEGSASEQPVNRVYPKDSHDLFAGEQLVIVGRYKHPGTAKVVVKGRVGDKEEKFDFPATLVEKSNDESTAFIEKLWAVRRIGEILDQLDLKGKNQELVNELIALSRRHGVMTPYTSFMADENGARRDASTTFQEVDRRLDALSEVEGQIGVEQREAKEHLLKAKSPMDGTYAGGAEGGGFAGRGSGAQSAGRGFYFRDSGLKPGVSAPLAHAALAQSSSESLPAAASEPADMEGAKVAQNVRSVGRKVFYRRGDKWIDSTVTADQEKQPIKIERYSKEYFELIDTFGRDVAKYMAFDEPVVIELDGKAYAF
ncbi:MAG TPA: VWA domain-containing protein, partial [Pirellulales bacterium]|nr:VWA domain-containing protein [Pirellulales bacterium]